MLYEAPNLFPDGSDYMGLVVNRLAHPPPGSLVDEGTASADPRILILSVSPDLSASYIPVMNSIFSAQKLVRAVESNEVIHVILLPYDL
jgi:hypothetical protein